jgi:hypothetical protein
MVKIKGDVDLCPLKFLCKVCMLYIILLQISHTSSRNVNEFISLNKGKKRKVKGFNIKPRNTHLFKFRPSLLDDLQFRRMFRFPTHMFQKQVETHGADLVKQPPKGFSSLPNGYAKVLCIAIHRLASGNYDVAIGTIFGVSKTTVYRATERCADVFFVVILWDTNCVAK